MEVKGKARKAAFLSGEMYAIEVLEIELASERKRGDSQVWA